jgi:hypothetical protein
MPANAKFGRGLAMVALVVLATGGMAMAASKPNLEEVRLRFRRDGPEATNRWLNDTGQSDAILDHMDRGEAGWIALASQLATDNGGVAITEGLPIALAWALPRNPTAVLKAIDPSDRHSFSVHDVCGQPFIEPTRSFMRHYKRRALAAVTSVDDPRLRVVRDACLRVLRKT